MHFSFTNKIIYLNNVFQAPESPDPWNTVIDATEDAPFCIQKNYLFNEHPPVEGKEDCLYLNVYTPKVRINNMFKLWKII